MCAGTNQIPVTVSAIVEIIMSTELSCRCGYCRLNSYSTCPRLVEITICTDCTNPFFYVLVPTCFGSSLPSSGSFLDPSELLEIQIEWAVYHIICVVM
jgi:hypothetical protein